MTLKKLSIYLSPFLDDKSILAVPATRHNTSVLGGSHQGSHCGSVTASLSTWPAEAVA